MANATNFILYLFIYLFINSQIFLIFKLPKLWILFIYLFIYKFSNFPYIQIAQIVDFIYLFIYLFSLPPFTLFFFMANATNFILYLSIFHSYFVFV